MADAVTFLAPLPPVGLRRNRLTSRYGWQKVMRREYSEAVWLAYRDGTSPYPVLPVEPWKQAHIRLEWRSRRTPPDADNALASCKALIDCLRVQRASDSKDDKRYWLGIIEDDGEGVTMSITTNKVPKPISEGVLVTVTKR